MARWAESERGLVRMLLMIAVGSWAVLALVWTMAGATAVLLPLAFAALTAVAVGGWMHDYPRVDK